MFLRNLTEKVMIGIGERLKEERERLGLNQTQMGAIGGVRTQAQLKYEKEESFPNAQYFFETAKRGLDVQYVVTGVRSTKLLTDEEQLLLDSYRKAPPQMRLFILQGIQPPQQLQK